MITQTTKIPIWVQTIRFPDIVRKTKPPVVISTAKPPTVVTSPPREAIRNGNHIFITFFNSLRIS